MHDLIAPTELLTPTEMAQADRFAMTSGMPETRLMARAGWAVARAARRFGPCRLLVLCGPGNNGGDGWVAAKLLSRQGWPVEVATLQPAHALAADWHGPIVPFSPQTASRAELVIDAVFGAGLNRDLDGLVADTLRAAPRILAVDTPSGLDGNTGQPRGFAPQAALTVTFFRLKPAHVLYPGRQLCGHIILADIGIPETALAPIGSRTFFNQPALWSLPQLNAAHHKYSRGHVTVLGSAAMPGAARLAASAARQAGAGLVTVAASQGGDLYRSGDPGLIVSDCPLPDLLQDERRRVWICGPGLGADQAATAWPLLRDARCQVVGDADLFTAFAGTPEALHGCTVLTPHLGEYTRMFGAPGHDRLDSVRRAARRIDGVVVLKGADTIIAAPDGRAAINASAPPFLATAGAGDVLAGVIAALLANGMAAWEAACAGVWLHGHAAAIAGEGMIAEDLLPVLRQARMSAVG